ncbi:MAG TPA: FecR domain-containing protein, partial [Polyangiaceae bacterium]|nr:FecR domain-containing protein [Polyangiaceae bacterium]
AGVAAGGLLWVEARSASSIAGSEHSVLADAKLETKSDELAVTLSDGSSVKLGSQSEVRVHGNRSASVSLALGRGELSCDVTHVENRKFTVVAGDVEVRVIGTQFSVKRTPGPSPRVEVSVTRGVVEVESARRPGVVARVAAGQNWIQNAESALPESQPAPAAAPAPSGAEPPAPELTPPSAASAKASPSARELFEKAGENRRAGDAAAAAQVYEELLRLHPSDARASLAAFELGRLRMDRLGDVPGAITALERAVTMNVGPTFREDALARLVSAHAAQGNFAACKRARDRYLSSYPAGVHAGAVATRCGSP